MISSSSALEMGRVEELREGRADILKDIICSSESSARRAFAEKWKADELLVN